MTPGLGQILLVLLVVLILFGAGKLPKVMGDLGKGIKSFKKGMDENADELSFHEKTQGSEGKNDQSQSPKDHS